jgi:hypothetical protein
VIVGVGGPFEVTVKIPSTLVTEPAEFDTMQRNLAPLSDAVTAAIVYCVAVAPAMLAPFRCH